ncbi:MAG: DUF2868 domain-containing protein, partial [Verrucomicrobiaceae bacterium]
SFPWAAAMPSAAPDARVIDASRWLPGASAGLPPGPSQWWEFLLLCTVCWGLFPRTILWVLAWKAEQGALSHLDFQGRHHRILWRDLTGNGRTETMERPLDGVLVLDVGGSGLSEEALRPFLLRHLRVHPAAWQTVAVLDTQKEEEATRLLAKAPAGIVLLAEGWSLSPARMLDLHAKVRRSAGPAAPVKFLVANAGPDHAPVGATEEERREWSRFVDSLRDPAAEIFFYEIAPDGL